MAQSTDPDFTDIAVSKLQGRAEAWLLLESIDPAQDGWDSLLAGLGMVWVDALMTADGDALNSLVAPVRDRLSVLEADESAEQMRGWLRGWLSLTTSALARLPTPEELALRENSQAVRFMERLCNSHVALNSTQLTEQLGVHETQVSRTGRELLARGLVSQRRAGRMALWELTPRGHHLLKKLRDSGEKVRHVKPGRTASRRAAERGSKRKPARVATPQRMYRQSDESEGGIERFVLQHPAGGWHVAAAPDGKAVSRHDTKQQALERAKQIVANSGGGQVVSANRDGSYAKPIRVSSAR